MCHPVSGATAWISTTDALVNRSQVKTHSAERIIEVRQQVNEAFRKAKERGWEHYGIFKMVRL